MHTHYLFVKENDGELPSTSNVDLYINGVKKAPTKYATENGDNTAGGFSSTQWVTQNITSVDVFAGASGTSVQGLQSNKTGFRDTIDEISFFNKALSDGSVSVGQTATGEAGVYTGSYHDLSNLPSSYELKSYFQCGDGSKDNKAGQDPKAYDIIIGGTSYITLADVDANTATKSIGNTLAHLYYLVSFYMKLLHYYYKINLLQLLI